MVVLYLKRPQEASRTEVTVERIEGMAVQELTAMVAEKTKMEPEEMNVMYGGCVLRAGKTLDQYHIREGCTLHVLRKRKKEKLISLPTTPEGMSVIFASPTVQGEITPFLNDPDLVAQMVPMGDRTKIQEILQDPDLKTKMADMARISHYIHQNSLLLLVMEALLKLHRLKYSVRETEATPSIRANYLRQLVEGVALAGAEEFDESERLATAQEQMFEHSQALHAQHRAHHHHPHQAHPSSHHHPPLSSSTASASSHHYGSTQAAGPSVHPSLTPADLATALANIVTEQTSSQTSSQPPSQPPSHGSSTQPPFFHIPNLDFSAASAPASLQIPEQPSPATSQPPPVLRSLSDSGRGHMGSGPAGASSITSASLQQALDIAMGGVQRQPSTSSSAAQPSRPQEQQLPLRDRYRAHLEQLHAMGITNNDAECLHALDAAGGDLQVALEMLMGPGH